MELQDLFSETTEVSTEYKGRTFKSQVFTERLTPAYKASLILLITQADEGEKRKDETAQMLADLHQSWTDGDGQPIVLEGQPFPPTYENLMKLSFQLLAALLRSVTTHLADSVSPKE